MMKYMRACWHKKRNETFKKNTAPKIANSFGMSGCKRELCSTLLCAAFEGTSFSFFLLFLLAQNRSAPLSPGFLFTKPSELFSSEHFYLYPHVGGTAMSCLLMWKAPAGISPLFVTLKIALTHFVWAIANCSMPRLMGCCSLFCLSVIYPTPRQYFFCHTHPPPSSYRLLSVRGWNFQLGFMTHSVDAATPPAPFAHLLEIGQAAQICIPIKFIYIYFNFH